MLNVAIVGYGNLGKAIEQKLKQTNNFNIVGVFSNRHIENTIHISKLKNYKQNIDLLFLCGGSQNMLEDQGQKYIKDFNIIESYDNHNKLSNYINKINTLAKRYKKISLCSFGWDPGLFSYMRGLFDSLNFLPNTFWGKGLSQGHTQAIKNVEGVVDGLQFTIPNKKAINKVKKGKTIKDKKSLHKRICYVVCKKSDKSKISQNIKNMPDYFKGYKTNIRYVSQKRLTRQKNFSHKGCVITKNEEMSFSIKTKSNPDFTANIMVTYAKCFETLIKNKTYGAFTIFDIPLCYILAKDKFKYL